jgi:hypothetical protein
VDDISTDFSGSYNIEMVLRDFPAQAAAARFDLANSFIDFTSSPTYAAGQTDSIRLNQSVNSLTAGGNLTWRIPRTLLVNSTLTNITGVRLRLVASGAGTAAFIASALRLVPASGYIYEEVDVETKREALTRSVPQAGGTEPSTTFGFIYWNDARPIDNVLWAKITNGANPVGNDNRLVVAFRYSDTDSDSWRVTLSSRSTQSRLSIDHWDGSSSVNLFATPINTNILTANKTYYLRIELDGDRIKAEVYNAVGAEAGTLVYGTGWQNMNEDIRTGYVGYSFEPYNYDFILNYIGTSYQEYGSFESSIFESNNYVKGATLYEYSSKDIDVYSGVSLAGMGDFISAATTDGTFGVKRSGNLWYGGITTSQAKHIGDARFAKVSGEILAAGAVRGEYRVAIFDENGQVVWMNKILSVVQNQWRSFEMFVSKALLPDKYTIQVHQTGFFPDEFKVRNLAVTVDTVAWFGSNDGGTNYYPFLNSVNGEHTALHFDQAGNLLRVKAFLMDSDGWIQGYKLKPFYSFTGRVF